MPVQLLEGPLSAMEHEDGFDAHGYPVQHTKATIKGDTFSFTTRPKDKFLPRIGDHLIVELDTSGCRALRCYAPYRNRGVGKGWKDLMHHPSAAAHRYRLIRGTVKHKEINHVRADITRDSSWPSHYYRVVLTDGDDFLLAEKLGGGVKPGDTVQLLWNDDQGLIAYRNTTRGHRSGPIWTDWSIVLIASAVVGWMFFHFVDLLGEPDGGKIFMLLLLGAIPTFFIGSLLWREYDGRKKLALLDERVQQAEWTT